MPNFGGDETRSGYMQYVQGIQPNIPARTTFIYIYANLVILATPVLISGHQVVCLGHLGGFVAF